MDHEKVKEPQDPGLASIAIGIGASPIFGGPPPSITGGGGSGPSNTHDVVGVGAATPDVVAVNSVNDVVQVGA